MRQAFVLGAGAWGRGLGQLLKENGWNVTLGARDDREVASLAAQGVKATADWQVCEAAEVIVSVVPTQALRDAARRLFPHLGDALVISASKGLELGSYLRPTQILAEEFPGRSIVALSGPNLSDEIMRGLPASTVIAGEDAAKGQNALNSERFRVYTNKDIIGVELGGALKNVIALAAGALDGMGLGDNAKAALVTRGLAEMTRLGVAMGAMASTFAGLAGLGDLMATCASPLSRNHRVGEMLAAGKTWKEIEPLGITAEGVATTFAAREMAARHGVELPITEQVYRILVGEITAQQAVEGLMGRSPKSETERI